MNDMADIERRLADLERRLANLIRVGTVSHADYDARAVRVLCDDITTDWLPWKTRRAGGDVEWWAPEVGEQVEVISPSGLIEAAYVGPALYSNQYDAPETSPDRHTIRYKNGDSIVHDRSDGSLTIVLAGPATIEADGPVLVKSPSVTIDAPDTTCTGKLLVQGLLTYQGGMSGSGGTSGSTAIIQGNVKIEDGDLEADGISLKRHTHTEQGDGAETSSANAGT